MTKYSVPQLRKAYSIRQLRKAERRVINLPLNVGMSYLVASMALFLLSPMYPVSRNGILAIIYGLIAVCFFAAGYRIGTSTRIQNHRRSHLQSDTLNVIVFAMCLINVCYFLPQVRMAFHYYRSIGTDFILTNVGGNYFGKNALMEQIGQSTLGPVYAVVNLLSFSQCAAYAIAAFGWRSLPFSTKGIVLLSAGVTALFYIAIGTMSGIFNIFVLATTGWLVGRSRNVLATPQTTMRNDSKHGRLILIMAAASLLFFVFMVFVLSSRAEKLVVTQPILYPADSFIYSVLGKRLGDGLGLALSYISQGWYGLGNTFEVGFHWTEGMSFSRVFTSYYDRFFGPEFTQIPLSYPVRQQPLTGYPAYVHWFTIFPWLASDFTFPGALVLTSLFGAVYGRAWIFAIREGCLVSISLFALLSIGVLFINANSQILDSKPLTLSLLGLLALYPLRRQISNLY